MVRFVRAVSLLLALAVAMSSAEQQEQCPPPYTREAGAVGRIDYIHARQTCTDACNADGYCCTLGYGGSNHVPCTTGCHIAFFATDVQACYDECELANSGSINPCRYTHSRHSDVGSLGFDPAWDLSSGQFATPKCGGSERCGCSAEEGWGSADDRSSDACRAGCERAALQSDMYQATEDQELVYDPRVGLDVDALSNAMTDLAAHVNGTNVMNTTDIDSARKTIWLSGPALPTNLTLMLGAMDLIDTFEASEYGPLFVNSRSSNGFSRNPSTSDGRELERAMLQLQQSLLDEIYHGSLQEFQDVDRLHAPIIEPCKDILEGRTWQTSNYYPGSIAVSNSSSSHVVEVDATMPACWGRPVAFCEKQAIRPTGIYLQAGGVAKVTAPQSIVDAGSFQLQVGASNANLQKKKTYKRNDRITTTYEIKSTTTYVANPLGGGIYLRVPYLSDLGTVSLNITGSVVLSPFFRRTALHNTTEVEWSSTLQNAPGAWADLETQNTLLQVPRNWMYGYGYNHFEDLARNYTMAMDGVSELFGFPPELRNNYVLYLMPDLLIRHGVYSIGYPQTNNIVRADANGPMSTMHSTPGQDNQALVTAPERWDVTYHELGHAQLFTKYKGEGEAAVNLLQVYVRNVKFGVDLEEAFIGSVASGNFSLDGAAINWMITDNFRGGNEMDISGSPSNEVRYQHRGYGKYADVARLYGWEVLSAFFHQEQLDHQNGTIRPSQAYNEDIDDRTFRLSIAAGEDLTPLIEFWGVHPYSRASLKERMDQAGLIVTETLRNHIARYATLVPMDQTAFAEHFDEVHPGKRNCDDCCSDARYGCGWYAANYPLWNETKAADSVAAVFHILEQYPRSSASYEGEDASFLSGVIVKGASTYNVTGTGFIDFGGQGSYAEWNGIDGGAVGGRCILRFRYVAGQNAPRICNVTVDGQAAGEVLFERTSSWNDWQYDELEVTCQPRSNNMIRLTAKTSRGGPNIDHFIVEQLGISRTNLPSAKPSPVPTKDMSSAPSIILSSTPSASPSLRPTGTGLSTLYEGEGASALSGSLIKNAGTQDVTGTGYIDMGGQGSYVEWSGVDGGAVGGRCIFKFRYVAGQNAPRSCDMTVNGEAAGEVRFDSTGTWSNWQDDELEATCQGGSNNVIRLTANTSRGGPNIDHVVVERLATLYEGEDASSLSGTQIKNAGTYDVTGTGFIDMGGEGSFVEWSDIDGGAVAGPCILRFRYVAGQNAPRICNVTVDGQAAGEVLFERTSSWYDWQNDELEVTCQPGSNNVIRLTAKTSRGGPNIDHVVVERLQSDATSRRKRILLRKGMLGTEDNSEERVLRPRSASHRQSKPRGKAKIILDDKGNPPGLDRDAVLAKNRMARRRWRARARQNYDFEYERDFAVPLALRGPFVVQVRAGVVASVVYKHSTEEVPSDIKDGTIPTIENIFESIQKEANADVGVMEVDYDESTGHPLSRTVSYLELGDDDEGERMQMDFIRNLQPVQGAKCRPRGAECDHDS